ncbi:unnamed protein product, partial [marine sediment metagenome]
SISTVMFSAKSPGDKIEVIHDKDRDNYSK